MNSRSAIREDMRRGASDQALASSVPDFACRLPILLVDHDSSSLSYMASFLQIHSFEVTTTGSASEALSILQRPEKAFKIVMANFDVPVDRDISLLSKLSEWDVTVIFFTSDPNKNAVVRALDAGAFFLMDSLALEQNIKYIWQHALRSQRGRPQESAFRIDDGEYSQMSPKRKQRYALNGQNSRNNSDGQVGTDDTEPKRKTKKQSIRSTIVHEQLHDDSNPIVEKGGGQTILIKEFTDKEADDWANQKKSRFVWNSKLQRKFTDALSVLCDGESSPKAIWQLMDVPNLTLRQVASHLQKYKSQVQQLRDTLASKEQLCRGPCCSQFVRGPSFQSLERHDAIVMQLEGNNSRDKEKSAFADPFSYLCRTPTADSTTTTTSSSSWHTAGGASMRVHPIEDYFPDLFGKSQPVPFSSSSSSLMSSQPTLPDNGPGTSDSEIDTNFILDFPKSLSPLLCEEEIEYGFPYRTGQS